MNTQPETAPIEDTDTTTESTGTQWYETGPLLPGEGLPTAVTPKSVRPLRDYAGVIARSAETLLSGSGAVLFRNFPVASVEDFEFVVRTVRRDLSTYDFGSTPRSQVQNQIYTSTEYPPHQSIPLHNEMAYTTEWPMKIWFYCAEASPEGGDTPIADSRRVFELIPPPIRDRFISKGVMYVRNYGNGLDVPWEKVFNTTDRKTVEAFCRQNGILYEWKEDGELRTKQIAQAVAVHPQTGESVWFNQAHLFHISNLEMLVREALLCAVSEEDLPRNAYFGDGSPIETETLDEVRDVYRRTAVRFPWCKGDVLMLDNMLTAHGRMPFKGPRRILVAMAEPYGAQHPCR
ncbi:hypothetical protein W02_10510 [Nitrospira sp. KM1]|uniref:TauD/TfdA family dioxygenase n=1 Tax=Nitrospira sp. KM1 TaxID=1936990 RepID=UPI0013A751CF|nr:TauD/TfdA family dioxygenase [Nitrospira sp. KM1]BCA53911.1 hypothetical protein W02_10510 [Nitrospira sp. KM1]